MVRVPRLKRLNARAFEPVPCDFNSRRKEDEKKKKETGETGVRRAFNSSRYRRDTYERDGEKRRGEKKRGDEKRGGTVHLLQFATLDSGLETFLRSVQRLAPWLVFFIQTRLERNCLEGKKKKGGK